MDRRKFVGAMTGALIAIVRVASAQPQPAKVYRIGFLGTTSASEFADRVDALRAGLQPQSLLVRANEVIQ